MPRHEDQPIQTTPLALRFREPSHWAGRVDYGAAEVLIEVETDSGLVGVGESTAGFPAESTLQLLQGVASLFIGEPVFDIERLFARALPGKFQPHTVGGQPGTGRPGDGACEPVEQSKPEPGVLQ